MLVGRTLSQAVLGHSGMGQKKWGAVFVQVEDDSSCGVSGECGTNNCLLPQLSKKAKGNWRLPGVGLVTQHPGNTTAKLPSVSTGFTDSREALPGLPLPLNP